MRNQPMLVLYFVFHSNQQCGQQCFHTLKIRFSDKNYFVRLFAFFLGGGCGYSMHVCGLIAQFRYIKIQPKTIDLSTRLVGINPTNSVVIPMSLVLRFIVLG